MSRGARIMIVERVMPSRVTTHPAHLNAAMTDLQMMVQLGGRERTVDELQRMLDRTGFELIGATPGDLWEVVEALAEGVDSP
jgi:hypothetical protein